MINSNSDSLFQSGLLIQIRMYYSNPVNFLFQFRQIVVHNTCKMLCQMEEAENFDKLNFVLLLLYLNILKSNHPIIAFFQKKNRLHCITENKRLSLKFSDSTIDVKRFS